MENKTRESCSELLQYFHSSTIYWAGDFFTKLRRKYYVTPTSYIEMIISFQNLLQEKRDNVMKDRNKYDKGYYYIILKKKLKDLKTYISYFYRSKYI